MEYLKQQYKGANEKAMELSKPLTPKSERRYEGRIAPVGVPNMGCPTRKCVRKKGHAGECWPR